MELVTKVKEILAGEDERGESVSQQLFYGDEPRDLFKGADIIIQCEEEHGGEGEGSDYYKVYSFNKGEDIVYFKFQGWYQSYHGAEYENYFEVTPTQKTITVYELKN